MPTPNVLAFEADVARALDAAGIAKDAPAHDATAEPHGAIRALAGLAKGASLVLRATAPLGAGDGAFGPEPIDPVWLVVEAGAADVKIAPLRGGAVAKRAASRVVVERSEAPCCGAPGCNLKRTHAVVAIELAAGEGPSRLVVGEWSESAAGRASALAARLSAALGAALGVPVEGALEADAGAEGTAADVAPLPALALARFGLRAEGGRFVVRDYASLGPRAAAGTTTAIGLAILLVTAGLVAFGVKSLLAGASDAGIGSLALSGLVGFFGVTYVSVGRHGASFHGASSPTLAVYEGKLVPAPWESQVGAVGLNPEGHYGAAVPMPDVTGVRLLERDGQSVVVIDTDHGPYEAVLADRDADARYWLAAVERAITAASHPEPRETARKRARERARAETVAATT